MMEALFSRLCDKAYGYPKRWQRFLANIGIMLLILLAFLAMALPISLVAAWLLLNEGPGAVFAFAGISVVGACLVLAWGYSAEG
jgi:hypothetical protein